MFPTFLASRITSWNTGNQRCAGRRPESPTVICEKVTEGRQRFNSQTFATLRGAMGSHLWARATSPPSALRGVLTLRSDSYILLTSCSVFATFLTLRNSSATVLYLAQSILHATKSSPGITLRSRLKGHPWHPAKSLWLRKVTVSDSRRLSKQLHNRHNAAGNLSTCVSRPEEQFVISKENDLLSC